MLQIENGIQIATDDYYIIHKKNGIDELHFEVQLSDPIYLAINEEDRIYESTESQTYTVKSISGSSKTAKISCVIGLSSWEEEIDLHYDRTGTADMFLNGFKPSQWSIVDNHPRAEQRTIKMNSPTPLDVAMQVQDDFGCSLRFNTAEKTCTVIYPADMQLGNAYVIDTVNLRSAAAYKGKSSEICTRLYPFGHNGLTIASVNDGKNYIDDFSYTSKIICATWQDSRIESASELLQAARRHLDEVSRPVRSWKLQVIDLFRTDAARWPDMRLDLFEVVKVVDTYKGISTAAMVVEDKVYPHSPEKNEITVSTEAKSVQKTLKSLYAQIMKPNSKYNQQLDHR